MIQKYSLDFRAENNTGNKVFNKAGKNIFNHFYTAI